MPSIVETLASYVPKLIARPFARRPDPLGAPTIDRFPAALLFADITGFTAMTERLARRGPAGAEEVSVLLNDYFGQLIDLVDAHGGDVVKFAGDALLALWPSSRDASRQAPEAGLRHATHLAAQCALTAQRQLHNYEASEGIQLSMRVGIGSGEVFLVQIGGVNGRWEFLVAGSPLLQLQTIKQQAQPGDAILSPEAWALARDVCAGRELDAGNVLLSAVQAQPVVAPGDALELPAEAEAALRSYIPGATLARLATGQTEWLAELRRVTMIFLNVPDLNYSASLDRAQDVMRAMQTTLYRYEGSINKLSVDDQGVTLVGALGLPPFAHEDDAARGVRAALAMQAGARAFGLRSAIGVATGQVFCGTVGNRIRREYTMIGDVVNLATRLMQSAPDDLLCDAATYQEAQSRIRFETLGRISVKGKAEPVAVFRPLAESAAAHRGLATLQSQSQKARTATEIVGRKKERALLLERLRRLAQEGIGGVIVIEGDPGLGKSRLAEDMLRSAQTLGVESLVGAGDAIEKSTPYHAWRPVFSQLFKIEALTLRVASRARVLTRLQADPNLLRLAPLLNAVLPLDLPDNELTEQMSGPSRADNTRRLLLSLLARAPGRVTASAGRSPRLLILEDAHWFDSASWALVLQVSREIASLLTVIVTRPMDDPPPAEFSQIARAPNTLRLQLDPLSAGDALELVRLRLGVDELPEPVARLIVDKAEGHPFFSEELAYTLRDTGLLEIRDGACRIAAGAGDLRALNLPNTVQGVITSRIDRLSSSQQMTLKAASVIGRVFLYRILRDIHPIDADKPRLPSDLADLQRLNLTLLETPEPELAYIFKHAITQEVAYNLMLFAQRRQLHQAIAEWYERIHTEDRGRTDQLLAHHWSLAGNIAKAVDYLERAANHAARIGANAEAKALYERALDSLQQLPVAPERQRQLIDLAISLGRVGAYLPSDNILKMLKVSLDAAESLGEETHIARAHGGLGAFHYVMGRLGDAQEHFTKSMTLAEKLGLEELLLLPYNVIGRTMAVSGDYAKANAMLAKGITLAEKFRDDELLAGSLAFYASTYWFQGQRALGVPHAERGLAVAEETRLPSRIAGNLMVMGFCNSFCGFFAEAAEYLQRCLSIAEPNQFVQPMYIAYGCLGYLQMQGGDLGRARQYLDDCLHIAEKNKAVAFVPLYQAYRAEAELSIGDAQVALARAEAAVAAAEKTRQRTSLGEAQRVLGKVHARLTQWDRAEEAIQTSVALQNKCNMLPFVANSTFELGLLYRQRSQFEAARAACDEAGQLYESLEMTWHLERARQLSRELASLAEMDNHGAREEEHG